MSKRLKKTTFKQFDRSNLTGNDDHNTHVYGDAMVGKDFESGIKNLKGIFK